MKVAPARIEATLRKPEQPIVLLHGEDAGLVRLRAAQAVRAMLGDRPSPFQLSTLLKEEHGRLAEEAVSVPLDGSRRIVRVLDAGDTLVPALSKLAGKGNAAFIVLEAGALSPRSKLRIAAEAGPHWAAIACYPDSAATIATAIRGIFGKSGQTMSEDAVQYLAQELAGDASRRARELEKLQLYTAGLPQVALEDAMACCATENEFAASSAFAAAMSGQVEDVDALLADAEWEGATGPGLLAVFAGHVHRLLRVRVLLDAGLSGDEAGRAQRPPVYPRQLEALLRQARLWPSADLRQLLAMISGVDAACKRAATRDLTMASKLVLDTARWARRRS